MTDQPTSQKIPQSAWMQSTFWVAIISVLQPDMKPRPDLYPAGLNESELEQLEVAINSSGSLANIQKLCPPHRGNRFAGRKPGLDCISRVISAYRHVVMQRESMVQEAVKSTAEYSKNLGLNPEQTNILTRIVTDKAIFESGRNMVNEFTVAAGRFALEVEKVREGIRLEKERLDLLRQSEKRQVANLRLAVEKFQFDAAVECRKALPRLKDIESDRTLSEQEKTELVVTTLWGKIPARYKAFGALLNEEKA